MSKESTPERKQYKKDWALKNKERLAKQQKEWYDNNKEARKEYVEENKEKYKEYSKKYYDNNKEQYKEYRILNSDKIKTENKIWRDNNKEKIKEYCNINKNHLNELKRNYVSDRRKNDPIFKMRDSVRKLIYKSICRGGYTKKSKTYEILGCSHEQFKLYLESKFESWMDWDNYGKYNGELNYGWDIDHIIPNSNGINEEEIIKLNHYTNLQPLCSKVNRDIKRNIIVLDMIP